MFTDRLALLDEAGFGFDPSQPRDADGRWTDTGGGGGHAPQAPHDDRQVTLLRGAVALDHDPVTLDHGAVTLSPATAVAFVEHLGTQDHPSDLTKVHIEGHPNLFGAVARNNIARSEMPQIPPEFAAEFDAYLTDMGISTTDADIDPKQLSATQREVDGRKVGRMITAIKDGSMTGVERIWTSSDNKILDGHHRWAAEAILSAAGEPRQMAIARVGIPMSQLIAHAREFTRRHQIANRAHGMALEATTMTLDRPGVRTFRLATNPPPAPARRRTFRCADTAEFYGTHDGNVLGWLHRKRNALTPEGAAAIALKADAKAHADEITGDIADVIHGADGEMAGLKNRLKGLGSLRRKILTKHVAKGLSIEDSASAITDALRFTGVVPAARYHHAVTTVIESLKAKGYEVFDVENHWPPGDAYNGLHLLARHPDGLVTEIQIHTPESLAAKEVIHPKYEKYRELDTPEPIRAQLFDEMVAISDQAPIPPGMVGFQQEIRRPHARHPS